MIYIQDWGAHFKSDLILKIYDYVKYEKNINIGFEFEFFPLLILWMNVPQHWAYFRFNQEKPILLPGKQTMTEHKAIDAA